MGSRDAVGASEGEKVFRQPARVKRCSGTKRLEKGMTRSQDGQLLDTARPRLPNLFMFCTTTRPSQTLIFRCVGSMEHTCGPRKSQLHGTQHFVLRAIQIAHRPCRQAHGQPLCEAHQQGEAMNKGSRALYHKPPNRIPSKLWLG